jgi:hypothetical protein
LNVGFPLDHDEDVVKDLFYLDIEIRFVPSMKTCLVGARTVRCKRDGKMRGGRMRDGKVRMRMLLRRPGPRLWTNF